MSETIGASAQPAVPVTEAMPNVTDPGVEAVRQPNHWRLIVAAGTAIVGAAGIIVFALNNSSPNAVSGGKTPTPTEASANCDNLRFANVAADATKYHSDAFLPETGKVNTKKSAQTYIYKLFSKDGPLAGEADAGSLAAVMATVVDPSHDGAAVDPNFDYPSHWAMNVARYNGPNGREAAVSDCKTSFDTLTQVATYTDNWAEAGDNSITEIKALRDASNNINGMEFNPVVSAKKLHGILLKLNSTAKGLDGFTEVLISTNQKGNWDGRLLVKGITKGQGGRVTLNGNTLVQVLPQPNGSVKITTSTLQNSGGGAQQGPNQGNQGTGGSAGPNGTNPEAGPGGVTQSPATGGTTPNTGPKTPSTTGPTSPPTTHETVPPTPTTRPTQPTTTTSSPATTTTTVQKPGSPGQPGA